MPSIEELGKRTRTRKQKRWALAYAQLVRPGDEGGEVEVDTQDEESESSS